mgnify:CR=1 FL=1
MKITKLLIGIFSILFIGSYSYAQTECDNSLYQANKLYESGKIQDAVTLLEPCVGENMNSEERFEAYRLLAAAYNELKNMDKREEYLLLMLKDQPDYNKKPNTDSREITNALNEYDIRPGMQVGLSFGTNLNMPKLQESYAALSVNQKYLSTFGFQAGITFDYFLRQNTSATVGASIRQMGIRHELVQEGIWAKNYNELMVTAQINVGGKQFWDLTKTMKGYVGFDLGVGLVRNASINLKTENFVLNTIEQKTKDVIDERNTSLLNVGAKMGMAIDLDAVTVSFDLGYSNYFTTTIDGSQRLSDRDFVFSTQYINDDIVPRLLIFNIGFSMPLFYKISK